MPCIDWNCTHLVENIRNNNDSDWINMNDNYLIIGLSAFGGKTKNDKNIMNDNDWIDMNNHIYLKLDLSILGEKKQIMITEKWTIMIEFTWIIII